MDFHLTKEQLLVRKMYREFAENEVKPLATEIDEEERFPMETVEKMAKLGMMGIYFPKQYGGAGADVLSYAMCVEELAKVCGTTAVIVSAHTSLCAAPIFENGTEEQKKKYLPEQPFLRSVTAPVIHLKCFISIRFRCAQNHLPSESVSNTHKH